MYNVLLFLGNHEHAKLTYHYTIHLTCVRSGNWTKQKKDAQDDQYQHFHESRAAIVRQILSEQAFNNQPK